MKRDHEGGRDSPPSKKRTTETETKSQAVKIKNAESELHKLLNIIDPTSPSTFEETSGDIDGRIDSISKMTEKLGKIMKEQKSQEMINQERSHQEMENQEGGNQEMENQEGRNQEMENQEGRNQEMENQEGRNQEMENQERRNQEMKNQEGRSQEMENQKRRSQESKSQEPEYQKQKAVKPKNQSPKSGEPITQEQKTLDQKNQEKKSQDKRKSRTNYVPLNLDQIYNEPFTRFYVMKVPIAARRSINPFAIADKITQKIGAKPRQVTGYNSSSFTIEVNNKEQAEKLGHSLQIDDKTYDISPHPFFNKTRGLIYVEDVKINDKDEFTEYLQTKCETLTQITEAAFIKTRNPGTQAFILEFNQDYLPHSIYIPGER